MKKGLLLILILITLSCSNNENPSHTPLAYDNSLSREKTKEYSTEILIKEKFQEFYDLNILLKKHPDFKDDIEKRIKKFTSNPESIFELNDSTKVKNIRQKGELIKVSDSVLMTQVLYDLVTENSIKKDSVIAFITRNKIIIDSKEVISTKVKFTRIVIQKFK